jgi:hypothetical protein
VQRGCCPATDGSCVLWRLGCRQGSRIRLILAYRIVSYRVIHTIRTLDPWLQGRDKTVAMVREDPALMSEIEAAVRDVIKVGRSWRVEGGREGERWLG